MELLKTLWRVNCWEPAGSYGICHAYITLTPTNEGVPRFRRRKKRSIESMRLHLSPLILSQNVFYRFNIQELGDGLVRWAREDLLTISRSRHHFILLDGQFYYRQSEVVDPIIQVKGGYHHLEMRIKNVFVS